MNFPISTSSTAGLVLAGLFGLIFGEKRWKQAPGNKFPPNHPEKRVFAPETSLPGWFILPRVAEDGMLRTHHLPRQELQFPGRDGTPLQENLQKQPDNLGQVM